MSREREARGPRRTRAMIPTDQGDLVHRSADITPPEPLSLEQARAVLQVVVSTHQDSFAFSSLLETVAGLSMQQIKEALTVVGNDLMSRHSRVEQEGAKTVTKKFKSSETELVFFQAHARNEAKPVVGPLDQFGYHTDQYWAVRLQVSDPNILLNIPGTAAYPFLRALISFHEGRSYFNEHLFKKPLIYKNFSLGFLEFMFGSSSFRERGEYVGSKETLFDSSLSDNSLLIRPFSVEDYRHLFRGMRWAFANILEWEKTGVIMPEQLDRLELKQLPHVIL